MEEVERMRLIHKQLEDVPELIQHIQSLLPVKEADCTRVLSKSWLHALSTNPTLRFHQCDKSLNEQQETRYIELIDRTLQRYHRDNLPIISLDIQFGIHKQKCAEKWITQVASKTSLKELYLTILADENVSFTLPDEIFSSEHLYTLSLKVERHYSYSSFVANKSLHISNEPVIGCVNLRVLELLDVRVSHEVLHNLLSTCKLLEKINLGLPEGLEKIKVNNLRYLHELKIAPSNHTFSWNLEICEVPRLCSFVYDASKLWIPVLSTIDSIGSLRELHLNVLSISDDGFCDIISSKFPLLQSLTLMIKWCRVKILDIRSASLQRLKIRLREEKEIKVQVYASKLLSYEYKGSVMPRLSFPTTVPEQVKLTLECSKSVNHLFFLKMREALNLSSKFNIVIQGYSCGVVVAFNIDAMRTRVPNPATNVEKLSFKTFPHEGSRFLDAIFSICHPMYVNVRRPMKLKVASCLLKLNLEKAMEKKTQWLDCEFKNPINGKWVTLTSSSLCLMGTLGHLMYDGEFKLTWYSS